MNYPQWRDLLGKERLPAVVVDLQAFDRNIRQLNPNPDPNPNHYPYVNPNLNPDSNTNTKP